MIVKGVEVIVSKVICGCRLLRRKWQIAGSMLDTRQQFHVPQQQSYRPLLSRQRAVEHDGVNSHERRCGPLSFQRERDLSSSELDACSFSVKITGNFFLISSRRNGATRTGFAYERFQKLYTVNYIIHRKIVENANEIKMISRANIQAKNVE